MSDERRHIHEMVDRVPESELGTVASLLEGLVDPNDEEQLSEEDRSAIAASRDYFLNGGEGIPFEQVVSDCGLTMDKVLGSEDHKPSQ